MYLVVMSSICTPWKPSKLQASFESLNRSSSKLLLTPSMKDETSFLEEQIINKAQVRFGREIQTNWVFC